MIIRQAKVEDAAGMAAVLNRIIEIGGTTAHQNLMSDDQLRDHYIDGDDTVTCVVAEVDEVVIGWQAVGWWQGEPHIGSFVQSGGQAKGVGARLFALTCEVARLAGLVEIHASIRADNVPGLAYYSRMGFVDYASEPDFALQDGRVVGRVLRRYEL